MRCIILGASDYYVNGIPVRNDDLIIAADGGYAAALKLGITPNIHLGDMDSGEKSDRAVILPKEKDDTDTLYAVRTGLEKGANEFIIYGGTGGRHDHTFANIQTLAFISKKGARGYLVGKDTVYTVITNSSLRLKKQDHGFVSVFSLSDRSKGVFVKGLKYALDGATVTNDFPIGVSNEFTGKDAEISVADGTLLCIVPPDSLDL